jgi:hypothetical protein
MEEITKQKLADKRKAISIVKRFNEHGAQTNTFGYKLAKRDAIRAVNLLISELPKDALDKRDHYEKIKEIITTLK